MSMKAGIKAFGAPGVNAVRSELKQNHDMVVMKPKHASELTQVQKLALLRYLMSLKQE